MVKDNIQVDEILQPRPENDELDYPTEPHYPHYLTRKQPEQGKENNEM